MEIRAAVEEYSYAIKRLNTHTQRGYLYKLGVFAEWCENERLELEDVRVAHTRRFIEYTRTLPNAQHPERTIASSTARGYIGTLRIFLNWCGKEDGLEEITRPGLGKRIEMPRVDQKVIEIFSAEQLKALFTACERERFKELIERDRAILSVLLDTGIRASELITLKLDNVHIGSDNTYIKVFGKGRKEREVGLGKKSRIALSRYINRFRGKRVVGKCVESGFVFLSRYGQPLTCGGLETLVARLGEWAHIKGVRCSPHTFRHTFAINYLKQGGDVYKLSRWLGHASVSITEGYLRAMKEMEVRADSISVLDRL